MKSAILLLFLTSFGYAGEIEWVYKKGDITVNHAKDFGELKYNDVINTGPNALVIIKIAGKTTVKINENSSLQVLKPQRKVFDSDLWLESGSIVADYANKNKKTTIRIKTKHAILGVRGTRFFVTYGLDQDTWMCVRNGSVLIQNAETKKIVNAGEGIRVAKEMGTPRKLLWTDKLNWNLDPNESLKNEVNIEDAYNDVLNFDYD